MKGAGIGQFAVELTIWKWVLGTVGVAVRMGSWLGLRPRRKAG